MTEQFETLAIHAGQPPDPATGAVMTPVYLTSTYTQQAVGQHKGYEYSRTANPTRTALEVCLAQLEGGTYALATASGMAAIDLVVRICSPKDHILVGNDVYGGTYRLFDKLLAPFGLQFTHVDTSDLALLENSLQENTRMLWIETPTNPYLRVTDIQAVGEILARRSPKPLLVVDNTFATPYLQRPLELGADIIVHSTTKYLGGHSDVVGGAVILNQLGLYEKLAYMHNAIGAVPGPLDCFLVLRSLKTLAVRMERHALNAEGVVEFLAGHPAVERLYYPFHPGHPNQAVARRQMRNGGGMVSFVVKGGGPAARRVAEGTRIFSLAESLGGVESLIEVPALMTHLSTSESDLAVHPGLVRLSVGIEHISDLIADLDAALQPIA